MRIRLQFSSGHCILKLICHPGHTFLDINQVLFYRGSLSDLHGRVLHTSLPRGLQVLNSRHNRQSQFLLISVLPKLRGHKIRPIPSWQGQFNSWQNSCANTLKNGKVSPLYITSVLLHTYDLTPFNVPVSSDVTHLILTNRCHTDPYRIVGKEVAENPMW